jgi:hypothetical protein
LNLITSAAVCTASFVSSSGATEISGRLYPPKPNEKAKGSSYIKGATETEALDNSID